MISKIAFVLLVPEVASYIYNLYQSINPRHRNTAINTFEKRNVCRKTASAQLIRAVSLVVVMTLGLIFKV